MASKDKDVVDDEEEGSPKASGSKKKAIMKWVGIGAGVFMLVGVSVGASIYFMKSMLAPSAPAEEGSKADENKSAKEDSAKHKEPKIAIYYKLDPPFVVNFQGKAGTRFLQVAIELMTYNQETVTAIEQNLPVIKNNIVFLLSSVNYEDISTVEGKQKLRADTLVEVQKVLKEKTGKQGVEDVYFTSIVMQ